MEEALILAPTRSAVGRRVRLRRRVAAGGVAGLVAANADVIVWLWIHGGNLHAKSTGDVLTSVGRLPACSPRISRCCRSLEPVLGWLRWVDHTFSTYSEQSEISRLTMASFD